MEVGHVTLCTTTLAALTIDPKKVVAKSDTDNVRV